MLVILDKWILGKVLKNSFLLLPSFHIWYKSFVMINIELSKKATNKCTKYIVLIFLISDSKCIQLTSVSICSKPKWKVFSALLRDTTRNISIKNVMGWQNGRILRSRRLGQLPRMCMFYSLSLCEHISYFMKDVKIYSIASILHLCFIPNFHYVTLILHTVHILIWRQIMNLLVNFSCFSNCYLNPLIKLPGLYNHVVCERYYALFADEKLCKTD